MIMNVDIETYSDVDLTKTGVYTYASGPNFEILLIGYCIDDGPVEVVDLTELYYECPEERLDAIRDAAPDFAAALTDPGCIKTAYNANFERTCLSYFLGEAMPPEQWRCTAVHAATLGLPPTLGAVGEALGLPEDKQKDKIGKSLIQYFCKPCKPTKTNGGRTRNLPEHDPEKWKLFIEYNRQDVVTEKAIREKLLPYKITRAEQALWALDQKMNDRGIRIDMGLVDNILAYDEVYQEKLKEEARQITGLANPNSLTQLKQWLLDRFGVRADSITKDTLPEISDQLKDEPDGLRMMRIRAELGKTSTKKYAAMKNAVCPDGRLRGILQFYGANRTGRWAGRIVQVHNLPQNKIPDIRLARELAASGEFEFMQEIFDEGIPFIFSQLVRTAFIPSEGRTFVVADFSAIEARVIAWLAREKWRLEVFRTHGKIYEASAAQMFHVPIESVKKGSRLRQQGKIAELALGYGGAFGAIKAMDKEGSIPDEEIPMLVANWRRASPNICAFWREAEEAAKTAIEDRRTAKLRNGIKFSCVDHILFITLLSGRKLAYYDAKLETLSDGMEHLTYAGIEQASKKWGRLETWGGKLVENIVQATARDCLAVTMMRAAEAGYDVVMHVHDELICDVPEKPDGNEGDLERLLNIMKTPIEWADGLPLKGDGYVTPFYKKD